jgi:hypothetical protein
MTAEEIVLERYPDSQVQHHEAVHEIGQKAPIQPEYFTIYPVGGLGHQPTAIDPTEAAAFTLAAEKVLKGLRKPKGLRIKREILGDAGRVGAGSVPVEMIEAAVERAN